MKPGKTRMQRRANLDNLLAKSNELEFAAGQFTNARVAAHSAPGDFRKARTALLKAAVSFASAVDGEEP